MGVFSALSQRLLSTACLQDWMHARRQSADKCMVGRLGLYVSRAPNTLQLSIGVRYALILSGIVP